MSSERTAWIAELRRKHRPETVLTLLQLQELGPGLYTTKQLVDLLGLQSSSINLALGRLKCSDLLRFEGWPKKGRLIWWIADHDDIIPRTERFPRWVLRANAAKEAEVLLGKEREAAEKLCVHWKSLSNFLSGRYKEHRLLGQWDIKFNPVQFVTNYDTHFSQH